VPETNKGSGADHGVRDGLDGSAGSRRVLLSVLEDQARAMDELRQARARLDGILGSIDEVIWSADAETRHILYVNNAVIRVFGREPAEFFAQPNLWLETVHPDDVALVLAKDREAREAGEAKAEYRIVRPDGDVRWIRDHTVLVRGEDGRVIRLDGIAADITESRLAEQALVDSERQFRGLVEQSIAGIYIVQDGRFVYVNPRYAQILGYSRQKLFGREALSVVADEDRERVRALEGARSSEGRVHFTFTALRRDGTTADIGAHETDSSYGGRPAVIGLMQDISDKRRAEEQAKHHLAQLQATLMRTVEVATTISEMRDPYTAGHEKRVAQIAVAIGAELGLDENRLEGLRVTGYLHDIGKMTIPSEILSKPTRLSAIEMQLVKGHAQAGYEVLKNVEFPWPVAEATLQHHERMDGSGYPRGLKGEAILLEARILAVADVLEAMSSHRPYRPGLGIDKALEEIERGCGTLYDAGVVAASLRLFREKGYVLPAA